MPKPNPNRQAIVEQVQREIEQYKAGEIDRFTPIDNCINIVTRFK